MIRHPAPKDERKHQAWISGRVIDKISNKNMIPHEKEAVNFIFIMIFISFSYDYFLSIIFT